MTVAGLIECLADGLIGASQSILVEDINDPSGITANTNAIIYVDRGEDRGEQRRKESHVLGFMSRAAGD